MKGHWRVLLLVIAATLIIAGHGTMLYFVSSHLALSVPTVFGVIVLIVVKHMGLLSPLFAVLRGRFKANAR